MIPNFLQIRDGNYRTILPIYCHNGKQQKKNKKNNRSKKDRIKNFFSFTGSQYDHTLILKMLTTCGNSKFLQFNDEGQPVIQTILKSDPFVLYKTSESALTIHISFNCANMSACGFHSLSKEEKKDIKQNGGFYPSCDYSGYLHFQDSCLMLSNSLGAITNDLYSITTKKNIEKKQMFPRTYDYMINQKGYSLLQFEHVVKAKLIQPFEHIDSYKFLIETKEPPPIESFFSRLKGETKITDELKQNYDVFKDTWSKFSCTSLLTLLTLYAALDVTILLDGILYYFNELWKITSIYPCYFPTLAG